MPSPLRNDILLICNSEYGQSSVFISVAYELCLSKYASTLGPNTHIHIASFEELSPRITRLQQHLKSLDSSSSEPHIHFHTLPGPCFVSKLWGILGSSQALAHPPGFRGALQSFRCLDACMVPWTAKEYAEQLKFMEQLINDIDPIAILLDPMHRPAIDLCEKTGRSYMILSPNTPKEIVGMMQPYGQVFWKYPVAPSGYPYPLPWYLIPLNIFLLVRVFLLLSFSPIITYVNNFRKSHGITSSIFEFYKPHVTYLISSFPEGDYFPLYVPENIVMCGPIVVPTKPAREEDEELGRWLDGQTTATSDGNTRSSTRTRRRMKTVLINLGSHVTSDPSLTRELANGILLLLSQNPNVQVLWKLKIDSTRATEHDAVNRIKILPWLPESTSPLSILHHPHTICSVHHGGANSYWEAVKAGVPQVVMPVWQDTYDFARRAEGLGVGVCGNRKAAPGAEREEFGRALVRVVGIGDEDEDEEDGSAKELAELTKTKYSGREKAARVVLDYIALKRR
ncbi:UDP-Glycosyltransferase/glycogen phosphorylase [Dendrothele bispora CBS 962.96]|uniref:UDP-Glycosyltransferase/glycogen phosphorylase n=1 Tax=Dendrothele bispora (strain CBS 962.96) TaxID=1314807 RepID=A0A4V4HET9_DENBC|nr:UDP-Glycosyltransferase/glycogen phosphorylase [Dendrothele bispora CBS 962.96]